jgi:CRP-like cAMP-binding protein
MNGTVNCAISFALQQIHAWNMGKSDGSLTEVVYVPADPGEQSGTVAVSDMRELNPVLPLLRKVSLFAELDEAPLRKLAAQHKLTSHRKGAYIMRAGDAGDSLLIVESGVVEVVLDRPTGQAVRLSSVHRGEYFGEMALFDGQARSASAIALTDCSIIELDRESVLDCLATSPGIRKLLSDLSSRIRRTDTTVRELSEQVYRAAYANVHAAVSVELDTIKLLYQRTELRSNQVLEQAEQQAAATLARATSTLKQAEQVTSEVETRIKDALAIVKKRFVPIMSAIALVFTAVGVGSFWDLLKKYEQASKMHAEMAGFQTKMQDADRSLRIVQETMTDMRTAREAAGLNAQVDTPAALRRVALDYEAAKTELMERYLVSRGDEQRFASHEPEVVFEALDTYVTLALHDRPDGVLELGNGQRRALVDALVSVIRRLRDTQDAASHGQASWLLDRKLRDLAYLIGDGADRETKKALIDALIDIAANVDGARRRDNAALILASFGRSTDASRKSLSKLMTAAPWRAAPAAIALAKLGHQRAWQRIAEQLEEGDAAAYSYASLLAQEGKAELAHLLKRFDLSASLPKTAQRIENAIRDHRPRNCFEQRYDRWLLDCMEGRCGRGPSDEPIGGTCTLTAHADH